MFSLKHSLQSEVDRPVTLDFRFWKYSFNNGGSQNWKLTLCIDDLAL